MFENSSLWENVVNLLLSSLFSARLMNSRDRWDNRKSLVLVNSRFADLANENTESLAQCEFPKYLMAHTYYYIYIVYLKHKLN